MSASPGRILTTHTGSLPRPDDLIQTMYAKEEGMPVDTAALAARSRRRSSDVVKRQVDAGVDVVNDGEMSKPSYATYVKDRLAGFERHQRAARSTRTSSTFPRWRAACSAIPAARAARRRAATAAIAVRDAQAARTDVDNLKARDGARRRDARLHERGVAGRRVAVLPATTSTPATRSTSRPSPRRCATSTRRSSRPASCCRSTAPTSPWAATSSTASRASTTSARRRGLHIEVLNHALRNIPAEQLRMHLCWGNYEGPHHRDVPLADIVDLVFTARPQRDLVRGRQPAPRARVGRCSRR